MSYDPQSPETPEESLPGANAAQQRVNVPSILLIVVGVLNIFGALYFAANGIFSIVSPEQLAKQTNEMFKGNPAFQTNPESIRLVGFGYVAAGLLGLVGAAVTIFAGVRMRSLTGYTLCVIGSCIAAIPFLSCTGCCLIGQVAGIWALAVLLNADVKAAFR